MDELKIQEAPNPMNDKVHYFFTFMIIIPLLLGACSPAPTPVATATITSVPTETPIPTATQILLNISPEIQKALADSKALNPDGSIVDKLAHSATTKNVPIVPESIMVLPGNNTAVNELIVGKDKGNQRCLWNATISAWTPERQFTMEYETAPIVKVEEVQDGSLRLSALLYYAEHPELIPAEAVVPHYKINVSRSEISIGRYRKNQGSWPDATDPTKSTILPAEDIPLKRSWGWLGIARVALDDGGEIVIMSDMLRNPVPENLWNVLPRFTGFDGEFFLDTGAFNKVREDGLTEWQQIMQQDSRQIESVYPYPAGWWENQPQFAANWGQPRLPHVATLMQSDKSILKMLSVQVQNDIQKAFDIFMAATNKTSSPEQPFSVSVDSLPDDMSVIILFPGFSESGSH